MIRGNQFWSKVPAETAVKVLPDLRWARKEGRSPAAETAALMLYIALVHMAEAETETVVIAPTATPVSALVSAPVPASTPLRLIAVSPMAPQLPGQGTLLLPQLPAQNSAASKSTVEREVLIADATYDDLQGATGLARATVAAGVSRLVELGLIESQGSHQKRRYVILAKGTTGGWFKLPKRAIVREKVIYPFKDFTLRSKHELHALKLFLFLAARRNNTSEYATAKYETIYANTGIQERDIRKAISVLLNVGLLHKLGQVRDESINTYGPNLYYLAGFEKLTGYTGEPESAHLPSDTVPGAKPGSPLMAQQQA